jgi:hypothetical protein
MTVRLSTLRTGRALLARNFFCVCAHFRYMLSKPRGLVRLEGLNKLKKFIHFVGSRTRDLPGLYKYRRECFSPLNTIRIMEFQV